MLILGLTGKIASGKDFVAKILEDHGAHLIDADKIGHELLKKGSDAYNEIVDEFGSTVLDEEKDIDRIQLALEVFKNKTSLEKLNRITHPKLKKIVVEKLKDAEKKNAGIIVINAAILKEIGMLPLVDRVWVIDAEDDDIIRRLVDKGLTLEDAIQRVNSQASSAEYRKLGDEIIENKSTLMDLQEKVEGLLITLGLKQDQNSKVKS